MRRVFGETLTTIGGVLLVLLALVAFDGRVRDRLSAIAAGGPTAQIAGAGDRAHEIILVVLQAVRDQSLEHAPMMIFALAAMVLVLFMTRT